MAVKVKCERCGARIPTENQQPGQPLRCPQCWAAVEPEVPEAVELSDEWDEVVEDAEVVEEPTPGASTPVPGSSVTIEHAHHIRVHVGGAPAPATGSSVTRPKLKRKTKKKKPVGTSPAKKWLLIGLCTLPGVILIPLLIWGMIALFQTPPPEVIPQDQWKLVQQPGRFKVLLPGQPKIQRIPVGPVTMVSYQLDLGEESKFGVQYTEGRMPAERRALPASTILNDSCQGALMMMGGGAKEVSRTPIKLGDIPGMQLVVRVREISGKVVMRGYYDQPNGRLFVAMIAGKGLEPDQENVKRFFDSFEILKEGEKKEAEKKEEETKDGEK